jgi:hypothetical protein
MLVKHSGMALLLEPADCVRNPRARLFIFWPAAHMLGACRAISSLWPTRIKGKSTTQTERHREWATIRLPDQPPRGAACSSQGAAYV